MQIKAEALTAPFLTALSSALERLGRKDLALIAALKAHEYGEVSPCEILRTSEMMRSHQLFSLNIYLLCRFALSLDAYKILIPTLADSLMEFGEMQLGLDLYKDCPVECINDAAKMKDLAVIAINGKLYESSVYWATEALRHRPADSFVRQILAISRRHLCDWSDRTVETKLLEKTLTSGIALSVFDSLSWVDNPHLHLLQSKRHRNFAKYAPNRSTPVPPENRPGGRIRVGYFGADFHDHATMYLMSGLLWEHDHENFEIFIFSYGHQVNQEMRRVAESCADSFFDVFGWEDEKIVSLAQEKRLDIAVDLKGYTTNTRAGIFKHRLAPVQVSYLGYPGTLGLEYMDYIIADKVVIPPDAAGDYKEKIIYLPDCYQPNDNQRILAPVEVRRGQFGLPEDAVVLCCFNASYKIGPDEFDIWMRLLNVVEGSVLWLFRSNSQVEENLKQEAERRGINRDRIIFAERLPHREHLARLKLADVFVDTFNYNAHTTASDALWAGLPVVSKQGRQFAARVGASLLTAIGLPELIATSAEGYYEVIRDLAMDRKKLLEIKAKLARNRLSEPLFDTRKYTQNFESGLRQACEIYRSGGRPKSFHVKPGMKITTESSKVRTSQFIFEGNEILLTIQSPGDLIQSYHAKGLFYESEELELMRSHFLGGVFVDIGANVGNHTVFAAKILGAKRCVCFEANKITGEILKRNIEINGLSEVVDLKDVGRVVSSRRNTKFSMNWESENMGAARAWVNPEGDLDGIFADESLRDINVSYIKIDVEGNELDVLESLAESILRCRPRLFIEVDNRNECDFSTWLNASGYKIVDKYKRYQTNQNYFLTHEGEFHTPRPRMKKYRYPIG
jgi:FkbM family methyltransferase